MPLFTRDISYVNNALVRPIVAYINSKKTFIPVNCRVVKRVSEFDGSWTIYDSGLMDDISREASIPPLLRLIPHLSFVIFGARISYLVNRLIRFLLELLRFMRASS